MARASTVGVRNPEATRKKLLEAAFLEFYANGFQGGSINHVVDDAGTTKGALFHHFDSKHALGYAVVDEIIGPLLLSRWLDPLRSTDDPIPVIQDTFRRLAEEDIASGNFVRGCPLNNLAQEMSPLDPGFQARIGRLYETWREAYAVALDHGKSVRSVKLDVEADDVAGLLVAAQMGIWGSAKSTRDPRVVRHAVNAVCEFLESLRE
ncbi:MAG: TetR/AcrR family transcriptional regulator [Chloroflexi bacterium]|nr:TetR/AcrR family transcriptional regulator [Chloroflexota bacterium]